MSKNIVVFSAGTGQCLSKQPWDNPAKMFQACTLDATKQVTMYDAGIGFTDPYDTTEDTTAEAVGTGFALNVEQLYSFICANYEAGDKIFLFGFSRGAYTVRALNGLIALMGIKKKAQDPVESHKIMEIYYTVPAKRASMPNYMYVTGLPTLPARVHFLGVFDTVAMLGAPGTTTTPELVGYYDSTSVGTDYIYHALAMDEYRWAFAPTVFTERDANVKDMQQVWFAGAHSDVGGSYADVGLSDIALGWMYRKAMGLGLLAYPPTLAPRPSMGSNDSCSWAEYLSGNTYKRPAGKQMWCAESGLPGKKLVCEFIHQSAIDHKNSGAKICNTSANWTYAITNLPVTTD